MRLSDGCPIGILIEGDKDTYEDGLNNGLFLQVTQMLSGQMTQVVPGTRTGLTEERIEEIRRESVEKWGNADDPDGEAAYLEAHPEIATAVHDCELRIQMGQCAMFSK